LKTRLAIVLTHPIQYNSPIFELLANKLNIKVFYTYSQRKKDLFDKDFGTNIQWDIPLLNGYDYQFVQNTASKPGLDHFTGIKCPTLINEIEDWCATHLFIFGWNYQAHYKAMRYFKGKIPVLFRGDSTLLDYEIRSIKTLLLNIIKKSESHSLFSDIISFCKFKLRKYVLTYVYSHIDKALYVGKNNKAYFLENGLKEEQLFWARHAIDNNRFCDNPEKQYEIKAQEWRKKLNIGSDAIVLLFAGKFEEKKNPLILLKAFKQLKKERPKLQLIFLGSGPQEALLNKVANNDKRVLFLPFQNQSIMPVVYRLADIFCLPSQGPGETWGLAVNEAMACGRPVITSDKVGCSNDVITPPSMVFKANDIKALEKAICQLINSNEIGYVPQVQSHIQNWNFNKICMAIENAVNS